jgi:hypothetical protein
MQPEYRLGGKPERAGAGCELTFRASEHASRDRELANGWE